MKSEMTGKESTETLWFTRDPEIRSTPNGQSVCSFSMATSRTFTDKAGVKQQQSEFHNIVAWGRQAEIINQYCKKGSLLLVEGRLQTRSWDDDKGQKHYKTEIVAEQIQLGPRPQGQTSQEEDQTEEIEVNEEIDVSKLKL
jgi:single-strand DNA-binding protein